MATGTSRWQLPSARGEVGRGAGRRYRDREECVAQQYDSRLGVPRVNAGRLGRASNAHGRNADVIKGPRGRGGCARSIAGVCPERAAPNPVWCRAGEPRRPVHRRCASSGRAWWRPPQPRSSNPAHRPAAGWISNVGTTVSIGDQGLKLAALLSSWHGGAAASWPASHGGIEGRPILYELMAVGRSSGPVHKGTRLGAASAANAVRSAGRLLAALLSGCNRPPPPEVDSSDDCRLYRCNYRAYGVRHVLCSLSTPEGLLPCTALTLDSLSATIRLAIGACDGLGRQAGGRAFLSP